jgi:glucokinase
VAAVAVCVPGPLDPSRSVVAMAPNLGWVNLAVRTELEARLPGKRVIIENDVRAAALSEHVLGAGRGYDAMLAVFIGTGVGGGLVIGGKLYHGAHGGAGEIGHLVVRSAGPRCGCGRAGCVEAMAARGAIRRYVLRAVKRGRSTVLSEILDGKLEELTSRDLAQAVRAVTRWRAAARPSAPGIWVWRWAA